MTQGNILSWPNLTLMLTVLVVFFSETQHTGCVFAPDGTYREQHDGDSQRDGGEDSQADEQQHGVELVHLGEGVEQLCLYVVCVRGDAKKKRVNRK